MTDITTEKPLVVSTSTVGPYISLPLTQLEEVRGILDRHQVYYWVSENAISLNDGPFTATINLGREGNAEAVQSILDSIV